MAYSAPEPRVPSSATRFCASCAGGHWSHPNAVAYSSRFFSSPSLTSETMDGNRMRSGGLSPDSSRGVAVIRFENWSCLMSQVTFGNCLVNSSDSLNGRSKPVSK